MHLFLLLISLLPLTAQAFDIPKGLTSEDRKEVVRFLGMNSAIKTLSNPYPLGGYSGFEVGYSMELISVRDVRRLGCQAGSPGCTNSPNNFESEWNFSRVTFGKGLYGDIDLFGSFVPPANEFGISDFGGLVRWSFYQAQFLPINLSLLVHANQSNFNDMFMNRNFGTELIAGVNVDNFALYFGGGTIKSTGRFVGPDSNGVCQEDCTVDPSDSQVDPQSRMVTEDVIETHTVVGFSLHFGNLFSAAEVDRYRDAVYSMKLGLRF